MLAIKYLQQKNLLPKANTNKIPPLNYNETKQVHTLLLKNGYQDGYHYPKIEAMVASIQNRNQTYTERSANILALQAYVAEQNERRKQLRIDYLKRRL